MLHVFRPLPVESLRLLVFDLDGTLIDSAQDLCNSVNETLRHFGRVPLPDPVIAGFVGNGAPMLVRRSLAVGEDILPDQVDIDLQTRAYAFFLDYYRAHKLDFTYAYNGVLEALQALRDLHMADAEFPLSTSPRTLAVLTNKPVRPARGICEGLGLADYFSHIYGGDSFPLKKPDPIGLRALMEETGALTEQTVMIGDSQVDVLTARNAGVWSIGCAFGFGTDTLSAVQPDVLVDSPKDWTAALNPAKIDLQR
jgi:phosphoglycolate phosphatase